MLQSNVICKYLSQKKGAEKKQWASSLKKLIKGGLDHREVSDWNCAVLCSRCLGSSGTNTILG